MVINNVFGKEIDMFSGVYYKLLRRDDMKISVCCLQWFDEYDYNEDKFIKDDNGYPYVFVDEEDAIMFLNNSFDKFIIDEEYLRDCPIKLNIDGKEYSFLNKEQVIKFLQEYGRN